MQPEEILEKLSRIGPRLPAEALQAADAQRAVLTPRLLASLADVVAHPSLLVDDGDYQLPFYAMYLLAAWREPLAHPLLLGFLRWPGDLSLDVSGDIVTEDMDRMLAQTCGGDPGPCLALAKDTTVNEWARGAAIRVPALLTHWGELPREKLIALYREFLPSSSSNQPDPGLTAIGSCVLDLQLIELRDELLSLFDRGLIDERVFDREYAEHSFARPSEHGMRAPIADVASEISWWACFEDDRKKVKPLPPPVKQPPLARAQQWQALARPSPHLEPRKVGRNEPCPCGSGKKFKKCCGR